MIDVAYIVRPGDDNEELRYSLRSLANVPHRTVWIAGHIPAWVKGVRRLPTRQNEGPGWKMANAWANLRRVAESKISPRFALFNDDFYVLRPMDELPTLHLGRLADFVADRERRYPGKVYTVQLRATLNHLKARGVADPLAYTAHVPMTLDRPRLLATLDDLEGSGARGLVSWRTVYGNEQRVGGHKVDDVKVVRLAQRRVIPPCGLWSSADNTFGMIERHLKTLFPEPSPYER